MAEVNMDDTQSPEPVSELSEQNHTTNSQSATSDLELPRASEDLKPRSTLLPIRWGGLEYWPGPILRFVLYSPLRNLLWQMIDYFRPTTIHQRAYPPSKRPRPAKKFYTPKSKSASNSSANHICPTCECYRGTERYHDCPRDCLPFELPSHKPRPQPKDIIQCPYCRRYGIKGTRCSDGRQF